MTIRIKGSIHSDKLRERNVPSKDCELCIHAFSLYFEWSSFYFEKLKLNSELPFMAYVCLYFEFQIIAYLLLSLPKFEGFLLCLIILPIKKENLLVCHNFKLITCMELSLIREFNLFFSRDAPYLHVVIWC